jgi:WD40 repeat protein
VRVWNVRQKKLLYVLESLEPIRTLAFSPDGSLLVTAGDETSAQVWSTKTGRKVGSLRGHTAGINRVAFNREGDVVLTASDDGTVRVWHAANGALWAEFRQGRPGRALGAAFDPSGRRVVVTGSGGTSAIYECGACGGREDLLRHARARAPIAQ